MGRKRSRTWKYLFLCIAGLIALFLAGCSSGNIKKPVNDRPPDPLAKAKELLARRDFDGSLRENQRVLSSFDGLSPADEALFNIGLIYAHYGYQKKDYRKALNAYKRLARDFPRSPLAEQALVWIGVLEVIEKTKQLDIDIEERKKELLK